MIFQIEFISAASVLIRKSDENFQRAMYNILTTLTVIIS